MKGIVLASLGFPLQRCCVKRCPNPTRMLRGEGGGGYIDQLRLAVAYPELVYIRRGGGGARGGFQKLQILVAGEGRCH